MRDTNYIVKLASLAHLNNIFIADVTPFVTTVPDRIARRSRSAQEHHFSTGRKQWDGETSHEASHKPG